MIGLYVPGNTFFHRAPVWVKFVVLLVVLTGVFMIVHLPLLAGVLVVTLLLYPLAGLSWSVVWSTLKPVLFFAALIFVAQALFYTWERGLLYSGRMVAAVFLASLLTYTTRTGDLLDFFQRLAYPLRKVGVDPWRVGLVLSLTIRSIPLIAMSLAVSREAFLARGYRVPTYQIVIPVAVRLIRSSEGIGEAITARGLEYGQDYVKGRAVNQ